MRKLLWVVAVVALVVTVAAPAMALDFKFGAEYRVRFYDYGNVTLDSANTAAAGGGNFGTVQNRGNPRGVQLRVRPRFDASDDNGNITATLRLETGDTDFGAGGGANSSSFGTNGGQISIDPSNRRVGNGAGGSIGNDGVSVEVKWGYIDFALPWGVPLRVRAGAQPWYLPKGLIIDDDIFGVRAYGTVKPISYEAFWYRAARGAATRVNGSIGVVCNLAGGAFIAPNAAACTGLGGTVSTSSNNTLFAEGQPGVDTTRDNALDYYGGRVDVAVAPFFNPGAYFVYGDNRVNCAGNANVPPTACTSDRVREQWFAGATVTGKVGIVDYDLDFVYGSTKGGVTGTFGLGGTNTGGDINNPIKVQGWALDGGVHIPFGPLKFNILGAAASGDKQDGGKSEAYPLGPGPSWSGAGGQYELIGEGGAFDVVSFTQHSPTNLWMIGGTIEYVPVKALWIKLAYGYIGFMQKNGNCGIGIVAGSTGCFGPIYTGDPTDPIANPTTHTSKSTLGQEVHIRADYTIWTGFKVQGMAGWLIPTKGDYASKYILQLYYNF